MNQPKLGLSIAAIVGVTVAGVAIAQPAPPMGREVTREMARAGAERLFARLDVNKDGKLDAADRESRLSAMFDTIDANHDGTISRAEFLAAHREGPDGHGLDGKGPAGHGPDGMEMRGMALATRLMREADPQNTGTVTRDAFIAAALAQFDRSDTNHDGRITPEERRAGMGGMAGRGAPNGSMGRGMPGGDMPPPPPPPGLEE